MPGTADRVATQVPTGLPGIGARLPLGFASAIDGEAPLSPERLVEVACTAPVATGCFRRKA